MIKNLGSKTIDGQTYIYFELDKKSYQLSEQEYIDAISNVIAGTDTLFATISAEDFFKLLELKTELLKKKYENYGENNWKQLLKHYIEVFMISAEKKYLQEAYELSLKCKEADIELDKNLKILDELLIVSKDNDKICVLADFYFGIKKIEDCIRLYRIVYLDLLDNLDENFSTVLETLVDLAYCQLISEESCALLKELVIDFEKFEEVLDDNDSKIKSKAIFIRTKYSLDIKKELSIDDIIAFFAASEIIQPEGKDKSIIYDIKSQLLSNLFSEKIFDQFLAKIKQGEQTCFEVAEKLIKLDCSFRKKKSMLLALVSYHKTNNNYLNALERLLQLYELSSKNSIKQEIEIQINVIDLYFLKPTVFNALDEENQKQFMKCIKDAATFDSQIKSKAEKLLLHLKKTQPKEKLYNEKNKMHFHQSNKQQGVGVEQELKEFSLEEYEQSLNK